MGVEDLVWRTWNSFSSEASRTPSLFASLSLNIRLSALEHAGLKHCGNVSQYFLERRNAKLTCWCES